MGKFDLSALIAQGKVSAFSRAENAVPDAAERDIDAITRDILAAQQAGGEALLTIGRGLIEAKELLTHGGWLDWLAEKVNYSPRAAQRLMKLAREWTNATTLSHLGASKALALLVFPEDEREAFMSADHMVNGEVKTVFDMSSRELDAAIKERDEARKEAEQAKADREAAERSRAKMEEDMKAANQLLEAAQVESGTAARREAALREELEALKARPVEVAVENASEEQLEQARAEARAEAEAALEKKLAQAKAGAKAAQDKLAEAKEEARTTEQALREQLDQAGKRIRTAETEAVRAKKELAASGNETVARFKVYFQDVQEQFKQMLACLRELAEAGDTERHDKLVKAVRAVLNDWEGQV